MKIFLDLFFPVEGLFRFIFLGEGLLRFIFSRGMPFEIYFFPGEGPLRFFFLDFLRALPLIINGRPLSVIVITGW